MDLCENIVQSEADFLASVKNIENGNINFADPLAKVIKGGVATGFVGVCWGVCWV